MSLCGMPYEEHDEESVIWREKRVRARKEHRCYECGGAIQPGEEYGRAESLYDGHWASFTRCPSCLVLAELAATIAGSCALWGGLGEQVANLNEELRHEGKRELPSPEEHRRKACATVAGLAVCSAHCAGEARSRRARDDMDDPEAKL